MREIAARVLVNAAGPWVLDVLRLAELAIEAGIEQLVLFVAFVNCAGAVEQSIRERCLAVIDMRDDAEIPGQLDRHKALHYAGASSVGQSGGIGVKPCHWQR